jgi:hypothetical protein
MVVREAFGFAEPRPEDHVHHNELSVVPTIQLQLSKGYRPVVIERWLRVYGDSLRRIAEAEAAWWNSEVEMALLESGMTEGEMLQAQADIGSQMTPLIEQALLAIYHGQQEHAWSQVFVEHVEGALEATGWAGAADLPGARGNAGEVARRWRDVLLPGAGRCRAGRRRDGGGGRAPRPSTGARGDPRGTGGLPGR